MRTSVSIAATNGQRFARRNVTGASGAEVQPGRALTSSDSWKNLLVSPVAGESNGSIVTTTGRFRTA